MKLKLLFALLVITTISNAQTQIGQDIKGQNAGDRSGTSVALSKNGSIVAIGAPYNSDNGKNSGQVSIFKNYVGGWVQNGNINGKLAWNFSGESVSLSANGSIVAIGSPYNSNNGKYSGSVSIFEDTFGNWTQIGKDIDGKSAGDQNGKSISLSDDGSTIAIGAPYNSDNGKDSGHVRVFKNISNNWVQIGQSINGEAMNDLSGYSLSLSSNGDILGIGALRNSSANGKNSGHVRIYQYASGIWTQIGKDIDGKSAGDQCGVSVDLSENGFIIAVGSNGNSDNGASCGQVRVYENISGVWSQIGQDINGESTGDYTGGSISLSDNGTLLAVGAIGNGTSGQGQVLFFKYNLGKWNFLKSIKGKNSGDESGISVSLSANGSVLAIGAHMNDDNAVDSGHTLIYNLSGILSSDSFVLENFNIYPNPTTDILNIELKENLTLEKVLIYNTSGQLVKETAENKINVSGFAKGIYNVQVLTNQGKATKKGNS